VLPERALSIFIPYMAVKGFHSVNEYLNHLLTSALILLAPACVCFDMAVCIIYFVFCAGLNPCLNNRTYFLMKGTVSGPGTKPDQTGVE